VQIDRELITLEVTGDGRFAYCERGPKETIVYEGVLVRPSNSAARFTVEGGGEEEEESADKEATMRAHNDRDTSAAPAAAAEKTATKLPSASIEGKALVRYERAEVEGHSPHLTKVESGDFRFAITVRPSFEDVNMEVWLQKMSSGQRQQRKHLARVDASGNFMGEAFGEKNLPEMPQRPSKRTGFSSTLYVEDLLMTGTMRNKEDWLMSVTKGLAKSKTMLRPSRSASGLRRLPAL
jgi:hypothetical protein